MAIWTLPPGFTRAHGWAQPDGRKNLQRSAWTGRTRELIIGPSDRWTCRADVRPLTAEELLTWRAFQFRMKQPEAFVRIPAVEGSEVATGRPTFGVVTGSATPVLLSLSGLEPGVVNLPAGALITVRLTGGDEQLVGLLGDLLADGSGNAVASLSNPLRTNPIGASQVELAEPWALMRATDPVAWSVDPGDLYQPNLIEFEEAF